MNTKKDPLSKLHALPKESQNKILRLAASRLALEQMKKNAAKYSASEAKQKQS